MAVERLDDPALIGVPVIVGGRPEVRGVVASASYEARKFGVHSAMPTAQALRLCPQAVLVSGHRDRYTEMSDRVMAILGDYTPLVEPISIDEAFLDVTGTEAHYGPPARLAQTIQDRIERELRLSASLGVAANKLVAKIASDYRKPHGITVVPPGEEAAFLAPLPIRRLWGVGEVTARELAKLGVETIGDLAAFLRWRNCAARFGAHWRGAVARRAGVDDSPVTPEHEEKSLSREETFAQDMQRSDPPAPRTAPAQRVGGFSAAAARPGGAHDRAEAALRRFHDPDPAGDAGRAHGQRSGDLRPGAGAFRGGLGSAPGGAAGGRGGEQPGAARAPNAAV